jgi:hypothetical protein
MKTSSMLKGLVLGLALLLTTGAFAANKGSLQVSDKVMVSGKQLTPGDYKVSWEGTGQNVELKIMKGKDIVATVPAHLVDLNAPSYYSSAVVNNNSDGSKSLSEIRFAGKKFALALNGETAKAESSSTN